jgi:hypothetical protein
MGQLACLGVSMIVVAGILHCTEWLVDYPNDHKRESAECHEDTNVAVIYLLPKCIVAAVALKRMLLRVFLCRR